MAEWLDLILGLVRFGREVLAPRPLLVANLILGALGLVALSVTPWLMLWRMRRQRRAGTRRELLEWALRDARRLATLASALDRGIHRVDTASPR